VTPLRGLRSRLWADYLMPSRLPEYQALLELALAQGYQPMRHGDFALQADLPERVLLLRHDIDTDVGTAARIWGIEKQLGIKSTYFFRLSTWDDALIAMIAEAGGEVGFHYEELATLMKEYKSCTPEAGVALLREAQDLLHANLTILRRRSGLPLDVAASHGDFANRRSGVPNRNLLADQSVRDRLGIVLEAYDDVIGTRVSARGADHTAPPQWRPDDPTEALEAGKPVVELLLHPRQWGAAPMLNLRQDLGRARDEARLRFGEGRRLPSD
jgi:hypothetical protein